jgi:hypothetical protein
VQDEGRHQLAPGGGFFANRRRRAIIFRSGRVVLWERYCATHCAACAVCAG